MSRPQAGPSPAVTSSGWCNRTELVGQKEYIVKQIWALHVRGVELTTTLLDPKKKGGKGGSMRAYCAATEADLSSVASQKVEEIMAGKRAAHEQMTRKSGVAPTSSKRKSCDARLTCPIIAAIASSHPAGKRTRTSTNKRHAGGPAAESKQQEEFEWSGTSPAFVAAMRGMTKEELLECLEGLNVPAAQEIRVEREEARQFQSASKKAIADASKQARTNEGRRTWQTLLTAAAYDGDGPTSLTSKRKAEILGVHESYMTAARKRVQALKPSLIPTAAMDENAYWFQLRAKRSDATSPELLKLMKEYWHTGEVSRATGKSEGVFRESEKPGSPSHPRRQLVVPGGGEAVFSKFLERPEFINFKRIWKSGKGEDVQDPGRTLFLSTRCKCLTAPKTDQ